MTVEPMVESQRPYRGELQAASDSAGLFMSVKPKYAERILAGDKTVELRRKPPIKTPPVVVIYGSGPVKAVMGIAELLIVRTASPVEIWNEYGTDSCIARHEFDAYFAGSDRATALVLDSAVEAERQVPLSSLRRFGLEPPQSWRYISSSLLEVLQTEMFEAYDPSPEAAVPFPTAPSLSTVSALVSEALARSSGLSLEVARHLIEAVAKPSLCEAKSWRERITPS